MTCSAPHRGSSPVGYLSDLPAVEAASIIYLRLWCEGGERQNEIWQDFDTALGRDHGAHLRQIFSDLCRMCGQQGRRPLMRHASQCKCVGGDEACFANFIAYASEGQREDALLMATLIVRPDMAPLAVSLATEVGLAFRQMQLRAPRDFVQTTPQHATLH